MKEAFLEVIRSIGNVVKAFVSEIFKQFSDIKK
jgi:hypothetical protein